MSIKTIDKETGDIGNLIAGGTLFADSPLLTVVSSYDTVAAPGWARLTTDVAGRTLLRADYKELFDLVTERGLIGTGKPFGEGDGSTTFVLPDAREATFKGIGLTSLSESHYDADGVGLGEFIDDQLQSHGHAIDSYNVGEYNGAYVILKDRKGIGNQNVSETYGVTGARQGDTTEVKSIGINYFMRVKMVPVPADFVSAMDKIYGVLIPSNASPTNKLVAKSDAVITHDYTIIGTDNVVADTQALVNHILTLGTGTYAGEFKRTGITFGTYRLTYFIDGIYTKSVSGIVTYSISNDNDATYQVSYVEDIEHGTPPYWKIERLSAINTITRDSTAPVMSGTVYSSLVQKAQATINDIISESPGAYSSLVRRGNIVQCIARFNTENSFGWSTDTKIGTIPQGYRPATFQPCTTTNFQSAGASPTFISIQTNGDIYCIPLAGDRLDLYINLTWYTEDV